MSERVVVYQEFNPEQKKRVRFFKNSNTGKIKVLDDVSDMDFWRKISLFFRQLFLPEGYPESVSKDYLTYQMWDTIQAFSSSISGSLATQAVLKGVGVGDENATPLAATITWLLSHGAGMTGQIVFTYFQGTDLDHNCKKWRLFADILNDSAMLIEISAPFWPSFMMKALLCTSGILRSLVGVAGGATRTAITQHQARQNNISDVAAKDGSQETMVNLMALIVNLAVLRLVAEDPMKIWLLFALLTCLHLLANFKAVRSLQFSTFNKERLLYFLENHFRNPREVPSISEVNEQESVMVGFGLDEGKIFPGKKIILGASLQRVLEENGQDPNLIQDLVKNFKSSGYFVFQSEKSGNVYVMYEENVKKSAVLSSYITSYVVLKKSVEEDVNLTTQDLLEKMERSGFNTDYFQCSTLGWYGKKTD